MRPVRAEARDGHILLEVGDILMNLTLEEASAIANALDFTIQDYLVSQSQKEEPELEDEMVRLTGRP